MPFSFLRWKYGLGSLGKVIRNKLPPSKSVGITHQLWSRIMRGVFRCHDISKFQYYVPRPLLIYKWCGDRTYYRFTGNGPLLIMLSVGYAIINDFTFQVTPCWSIRLGRLRSQPTTSGGSMRRGQSSESDPFSCGNGW